MKLSQVVSKLQSRHDFYNTEKKMEWPLLISACRLVVLFICAKFGEITSNGIKVIERTRFLCRKLKRDIIQQKM